VPSFVNVRYMHIKDTNEHDISVLVIRSKSIREGAGIFMKKYLGSVSCKNNKQHICNCMRV
jgi:hypothetical protein